MQVDEAFVSGSVGRAVYREDGQFRFIDGPRAEPRDALPNEVRWFHHAARQVEPAHPEGMPVSIDIVRARLDEEIRFFTGLDGLLVGMDRDFSWQTRGGAISRAEDSLALEDTIALRIRRQFLIPANTQEWDPAGALALALRKSANAAANCYRLLADGLIDRLVDDVASVVLEQFGEDNVLAREGILRSGILAELALLEARADPAAYAALLSANLMV